MTQTRVLTRAKDDARSAKARRRRRWDPLVVAAVVAAVGLAGAAVFKVSSQSGRAHAPSSNSSGAPVAAWTHVPESAFSTQPPFTGPAVTAYGQPALQKAYRQLVNFAFNTGWDPALMAKHRSTLSSRDFAAVRLSLTPSCAKAYDANVTKALAGDKTAIRQLEGSMFFAVSGIDATRAASGPATISNRSFTRAKFAVDTSHGQRLSMSFTAKATIHMTDTAGKHYVVLTGRAVHYLLVPNHGADANVRPFLIDAWGSRMQSKAPQPA